jgi:hypothetical protein
MNDSSVYIPKKIEQVLFYLGVNIFDNNQKEQKNSIIESSTKKKATERWLN